MKKVLYISLAAMAMLCTQSCEQEKPFVEEDAYGTVNTGALSIELLEATRAVDDTPDVRDFTVEFISGDEVKRSYKYGDMPEVVTLPVGTYTVTARYGENPDVAWSAPYYTGASDKFNVEANKVTMLGEPLHCRLSNIKVTVNFDAPLAAVMGADAKVNVSVGAGQLDFTASNDQNGYFKYLSNSTTLVARFTGTVDGDPVDEQRSFTDVEAGKHYVITYRLHEAESTDPGHIVTPGGEPIKIEATVNVTDINGNLEPGEELLPDDQRPNEGKPENPDNPDDPTPPTPGNENPVIEAFDGDKAIKLGEPTLASGLSACKLIVTSTAEGGITACGIKIDSPTLTPEELASVGLASEFDLIEPGDLEGALKGLGFKVGEEVRGQSEVSFDISNFLGLLGALGPGTHNFILTVTDANGTTTGTLILQYE